MVFFGVICWLSLENDVCTQGVCVCACVCVCVRVLCEMSARAICPVIRVPNKDITLCWPKY